MQDLEWTGYVDRLSDICAKKEGKGPVGSRFFRIEVPESGISSFRKKYYEIVPAVGFSFYIGCVIEYPSEGRLGCGIFAFIAYL